MRDEILYRGWSADDVARHLATAFVDLQCDGLFLPAVDHLGIRLPIRNIVNRIRERSELRFCFIDAAQAFCLVPLDECAEVADFIVAGSHQWMGAYLPTGIGLFGQSRTRELILHRTRNRHQCWRMEDPLLRFSEQLDTGQVDGNSETANLTPLLASAGAAADRLKKPRLEALIDLPGIDTAIENMPRAHGDWQLVRPVSEMRSKIALLKSSHGSWGYSTPDELRSSWLEAGAVVSAFEPGLVRVSLDFPSSTEI
jgi:hypothetical protein